MNILLVTSVWSGAKPVFFEGSTESTGMPAFNKMLKNLSTNQNINLRILLLCDDDNFSLPLATASWLKDIEIEKFYWNKKDILNNIFSFYRLFKTTNKILANNSTDLVYLHGTLGLPSYFSARFKGIRIGQRIYGTFLRDKIMQQGILKTAILSPFESAAFKLKKDFLIVTDDGTNGDQVVDFFNKNKKPYDFYFLQNGVNVEKINTFDLTGNNKYIFYPARITQWKRQDLAIELLSKLTDTNIKLYFAGKIVEQNYYESLISQINKLGLNDRVIFKGEISHKETQEIMSNAFAIAAFYDVSCKGNVALESIASQCLVVSLKNRGLDLLIDDGYSGIIGEDIDDCVFKLNNILSNKEKFFFIKSNLNEKNKILSWNERLKIENSILGVETER